MKSSLTIQRFYRGRFVKNTSFINALELSKYPKLYFLKEQKPTFIKLLKQLMPLFEHKNNLKFEQLIHLIKEDNQFDTVRVAEPDLFEYKNTPLVQFVKPSTASRIRFNKSIPPERLASQDFTLMDFYFSNN